MLSDTENGRMFRFNSFVHTHTKRVKQGSRNNLRRTRSKENARESEKHLRTQQFDSRSPEQQSDVLRGIGTSPDVRHMQHAMCC